MILFFKALIIISGKFIFNVFNSISLLRNPGIFSCLFLKFLKKAYSSLITITCMNFLDQILDSYNKIENYLSKMKLKKKTYRNYTYWFPYINAINRRLCKFWITVFYIIPKRKNAVAAENVFYNLFFYKLGKKKSKCYYKAIINLLFLLVIFFSFAHIFIRNNMFDQAFSIISFFSTKNLLGKKLEIKVIKRFATEGGKKGADKIGREMSKALFPKNSEKFTRSRNPYSKSPANRFYSKNQGKFYSRSHGRFCKSKSNRGASSKLLKKSNDHDTQPLDPQKIPKIRLTNTKKKTSPENTTNQTSKKILEIFEQEQGKAEPKSGPSFLEKVTNPSVLLSELKKSLNKEKAASLIQTEVNNNESETKVKEITTNQNSNTGKGNDKETPPSPEPSVKITDSPSQKPPLPFLESIKKNLSQYLSCTKIPDNTVITQKTEVTHISDEDLFHELMQRGLLTTDDHSKLVTFSTEDGREKILGNIINGLKFTDTGYAYFSQAEAANTTYANITLPEINGTNVEFHLGIVENNEKPLITSPKSNHVLVVVVYDKKSDSYCLLGYLTSKKSKVELSDVQFKPFQDHKENEAVVCENPEKSKKIQYLAVFSNMQKISKQDIVLLKKGQEYLQQKKIQAKIKDNYDKTKNQTVINYIKASPSKQNLIDMCIAFDHNIKNKSPHPKTEYKIFQEEQGKLKQRATNEKKYKDKLEKDKTRMPKPNENIE